MTDEIIKNIVVVVVIVSENKVSFNRLNQETKHED